MIKANGVVMPNWPRAINPQLPSNFLASSYPVLGDLDGDGSMECVIGSTNGFVHAFRANGSYVPGWPQATKAVAVNAPVIGDIDGDGLPEVVAGNDKILENGAWANHLFAWHANGTILPNWPIKYRSANQCHFLRLRSTGSGGPRSGRPCGHHCIERHDLWFLFSSERL